MKRKNNTSTGGRYNVEDGRGRKWHAAGKRHINSVTMANREPRSGIEFVRLDGLLKGHAKSESKKSVSVHQGYVPFQVPAVFQGAF